MEKQTESSVEESVTQKLGEAADIFKRKVAAYKEEKAPVVAKLKRKLGELGSDMAASTKSFYEKAVAASKTLRAKAEDALEGTKEPKK